MPIEQPEPLAADGYVLWGHAVSLFSGKARAYLRYKGIPFEERTPSLAFLRNELIPRLGTHLIPVVGTPDGLVVQDTTQIIDFLESRFPVDLLGVRTTVAVRPDAQWKLQRPLGYYQSLPARARAACDALLDAVGGMDAMQTRIENPVRRVFGRLCWDVEAGLRTRHAGDA